MWLKNAEPWRGPKTFFVKFIIVTGWILLILLVYKVSQFDYEMANFDPYEILGVPLSSSQADVKKAYRKLSLILHPDKETGNEKEFMKLTKAYQVRNVCRLVFASFTIHLRRNLLQIAETYNGILGTH